LYTCARTHNNAGILNLLWSLHYSCSQRGGRAPYQTKGSSNDARAPRLSASSNTAYRHLYLHKAWEPKRYLLGPFVKQTLQTNKSRHGRERQEGYIHIYRTTLIHTTVSNKIQFGAHSCRKYNFMHQRYFWVCMTFIYTTIVNHRSPCQLDFSQTNFS